jgi:hypothetical protein
MSNGKKNNPNKNKSALVFELVFSATLSITLLSGGTACYMASQPKLSPEQARIFETAVTTWNYGVGAIAGLLGGKATDLLGKDGGESED